MGSSAKTKFGEFAKDLAIATLCASPPDNLAGLKFKRFSNPRTDNNSLDFFSAFNLASPIINCGIITFSIAVNSGNNR